MTSVAVVSAGLRSPSSTRMLADELALKVGLELADADVYVLELREHAHAIADALLTGFATGELRAALDLVEQADGLVVVTPTFSGSFSGLFKSFFDIVEPGALEGLPVVLAATGGSERHSLMIEHALRPLFSYLKALPVSTGVYAATADFGDGAASALGNRTTRAARELATAVRGSAPGRAARKIDTDFVPFEDMLKEMRTS